MTLLSFSRCLLDSVVCSLLESLIINDLFLSIFSVRSEVNNFLLLMQKLFTVHINVYFMFGVCRALMRAYYKCV